MSIRAINWAIHLGQRNDLSPTMRHILLVLANFASDEDISYPRQTIVAKITGLSRPCVNTNLGLLEDLKLITATGRKHAHGGTRSSEYKLHIDENPAVDQSLFYKMGVNDGNTGGVNENDARGVKQDDRGVNDDDSGCKSRRQRGVNDDDTLNLKIEPSQEPKARTRRKSAELPSFDLPDGSDFPNDESYGFDAFWKKYPVKTGDKKRTRQLWFEIIKAGKVRHAEILEGLDLYLNKDDFREWCMAQTWLFQERWEERPPQKRVKSGDAWAGMSGKRTAAI